jgi:NAD(P)-dependent dehydrogenase (short-subunit alcohol dehydrogenase family)
MDKGKKTVVITGASSGIGRASVLQMSRAGWNVFATVRNIQDKDKLQSENLQGVTPVLMDVEDRPSILAAAEFVASQLGPSALDGLVNVAGIGIVQPLEYADARDLQKIFDVNVFGQLAAIQAFLPLLRKGRGRIVNITSVGAHIAIPFGGLLNASKSAFGMMSDTLRLELHPFGIRVCTIEPGSIATPAVDKTLGNIERLIDGLPKQAQAQYAEMMLRNFTRRGYKREKNGSPPEVVARAVNHALTAARPRIRYVVGKDARLLTTLPRILPDRILDAIRLRALGLPAQFGALKSASDKSLRRAA